MTGAVLLAAVALAAGGKPVTVTVDGYGSISGRAFVGGNQIWLTREAARLAVKGDGIGVFALLHETGHTTGLHECASDRFALTHLRPVLRRFWPRLTKRQINARIVEARRYPKYLTMPGFCTAEVGT